MTAVTDDFHGPHIERFFFLLLFSMHNTPASQPILEFTEEKQALLVQNIKQKFISV